MDVNLGLELQKLRKKETKPCPDCGMEFTAYTTALRCKKCRDKANMKKYRERKKMLQ